MLFVRTLGGMSHSREEDAREEDLVAGIEAFARLVRDLTERRVGETVAATRRSRRDASILIRS